MALHGERWRLGRCAPRRLAMHPRSLGATDALQQAAVRDRSCGGLDRDRGRHGLLPTRYGPARRVPGVDAFLADHWPHGASGTVLVARAGRQVACEGIGSADSAKHIPARCDTAYDIGSITKQFTAAAILKLQMMGRLRVTDPIDRFIDGVPSDKRTITITDLLTMTSGLIDSLGSDYQPLSREQMLAEAMRSRLLSPPGKAWHYSNVSYSILAAIIEKASGMGYERFLAQYLFRPAGMRQTGYVLPHWHAGQVAVEYNRHGRPMGRRSITPGPRTGPTGTCAATAASSQPPPTCCAGTVPSFTTPSSATTPSASCSPRAYGSTPPATATPTAGRSSPAPSAGSRRTTAATDGPSP